MREWVIHSPAALELPKLLDGDVEVDGHVSRLGGGVVAVSDVNLAVAHLVVTNNKDKVVWSGG